MKNTKDFILVLICTVVLAVSVSIVFIESGTEINSNYANLGSLFGGILGPTLSFASIILLLRDLSLQREELSLQREELKGTREIHGETLIQMKSQSIEDSKFKSIDYYHLRIRIITENMNMITYGGLKGLSAISHMSLHAIDENHFENEIAFYYHVIIQNLNDMAFEAGEDAKSFEDLFSISALSANEIYEFQVLNKYVVFRNSFSATFLSSIDHINKKIQNFPSFNGKYYHSIRLIGTYLENRNVLPEITESEALGEIFF